MKTSTLSLAAALLALAALTTACDQHAGPPAGAPPGATIEEADETLSLRFVSLVDDVATVDVSYLRRDTQAAPRMMELWLHVGADLAFVDAEPLEALELAGKELVVQPRDDGVLRLVVYAANNLATIDSGPIARLTLSTHSGQLSDAAVTIEERMPMFAPADANEGVLLGPPVVVAPAPRSGGKS